jgi:hypothetical protein
VAGQHPGRKHQDQWPRPDPRWFGGPVSPDYLTDRLGANLDLMLADHAVLSEETLDHMSA